MWKRTVFPGGKRTMDLNGKIVSLNKMPRRSEGPGVRCGFRAVVRR